jgi:predicted NBD/HSP70 family sugar kinase
MTQHANRRGVATDELRRHNLSAVLERIHLVDSVSRSTLADLTGLNRSTIRDLLTELANLGLVVEANGTTTGSRGRPSSRAYARPIGAVVLAAELEVDYTAVATIGLGGHILDRVVAPTPSTSAPPGVVLDHLEELARPLLARLPKGHRLIGIGVAGAGLVRRRDGLIGYSPNRGWSGVPLGSMLAERFDMPLVRVANEADAGALAEFRRGSAHDVGNLVYISGAVGLGIGVIHDGRPLSGALGYAGEAGHTIINPGGRKCRCGSTGCWETEVGQEALVRRGGLTTSDVEQGLTAEVLRRAHLGDRAMLDALREVGAWLGRGVGNLVNIFNPDLIVFGGFYAPMFAFLEPWILAEQSALTVAWEACSIRRSELGPDARLIGASELVFAELIADPLAVAAS